MSNIQNQWTLENMFDIEKDDMPFNTQILINEDDNDDIMEGMHMHKYYLSIKIHLYFISSWIRTRIRNFIKSRFTGYQWWNRNFNSKYLIFNYWFISLNQFQIALEFNIDSDSGSDSDSTSEVDSMETDLPSGDLDINTEENQQSK